ncbi:MAG: YrdB family protein, partial [Rhodospirillales bacterium]|nr:YrdB family protein [Rhodospirillales bacterium]
LEMCALAAFGFWSWQRFGWAGMILCPIVAGAVWGIFNVSGDPSRADHVVVSVPGWIRLTIEAAIFSGAVYSLVSSGYRGFATTLGALTVFHYLMSFERLKWLLKQ